MAVFTVNGTELSTLAWNVQNRSGRWKVPNKLGENPRLPGVHGALYVPGKTFDENVLTLTMWAVGSNSDGTFPASPSRAVQCRNNLEALMTLFTSSGGLLSLKQYEEDGVTYREALGEVTAAIDVESMAGGTRAEFAVEIKVPSTFWFDSAAINQTLSVTSADQTLTFTSFNGSAPLVNANFELTGAAASPRLSDPTTGQWVQHTGAIPAAQKWIVDSGLWTATVNAINSIDKLSHGLGATFLDLTPRSGGVQVRVQNANGATLKVTGKRAWLIA